MKIVRSSNIKTSVKRKTNHAKPSVIKKPQMENTMSDTATVEKLNQPTVEGGRQDASLAKILEMVGTGVLSQAQAAILIRELNGVAASRSPGSTNLSAQSPAPFSVKNFFSNSMNRLFAGDALHNSLRASHIESPGGHDYVFKDNEITMSNVRDFFLNKASFERNKVSGSNLKDLRVDNGPLTDSVFKMSNVRDTRALFSELRRWNVTASNLRDVSVEQESLVEDLEARASTAKDFLIRKSTVSGLGMKESTVKDLTVRESKWLQSLIQWSSLSGLQFDMAALTGVQFLASHLSDLRIEGSEMGDFLVNAIQAKGLTIRSSHFHDVLFANHGGFRRNKYEQVSFEGCHFKRVLLSNCRLEKVTFSNITVENVQLSGVVLKNEVIDGNEAFLKLATQRPVTEEKTAQ